LIEVRIMERRLAFCWRRFSAWRARFLAWAELAKFSTPQFIASWIMLGRIICEFFVHLSNISGGYRKRCKSLKDAAKMHDQ
jgi:hypothetical protein